QRLVQHLPWSPPPTGLRLPSSVLSSPSSVLRFQIADNDLDVVLLVAIEFGERVHPRQLAVDAHQFVALSVDPRRDRLMVSLAAADQRRAKVKVFRAACLRRREDALQE